SRLRRDGPPEDRRAPLRGYRTRRRGGRPLMAKTHIMRWAPQDYRTSRSRARSIQTRDPMLRLVYLEALFALYEAGCSLSADPTEVMGEAGEWNGRRQLNPASMSNDRLLNTVLDLRRMKAGQPTHAPPANARAQERKAGMSALIQGGLDAGRDVGQGNGGAGR